jgi:hypothetical protein
MFGRTEATVSTIEYATQTWHPIPRSSAAC